MKIIAILFVMLVLTACNKSPDQESKSSTTNSDKTINSGTQEMALDSVLQYLLTSAVTDFNKYGPAVKSFRDVRFGYIRTPNGEKMYLLCGEFMPIQKKVDREWESFETIKTSGYEQYIGGNAKQFCEDKSFVLVTMGDLSDTLQKRLELINKH